MKEAILNAAKAAVDNESSYLIHVSQEIWKNPELKYEEKFAHDLLTNALEEKGFSVERHFMLSTAFRAEYSSGKPGPAVAVLCEYDALPKIGHACGHNLIAEAGLGAGLAIKAAMEASGNIPGKVVVLGTPAEEGGGGKIVLIKGGAFKEIDVALMVHPSPYNHLCPPFIALCRLGIKFTGKEAHASGYPWEGINALDAAVACYNNIALLRQHIKPTCRIHAIISNGGEAANIIPGYSAIEMYYRAPSTHEMQCLRKRIEACIASAANATGCEVVIEGDKSTPYKNLITNRILANRYKKYAEELGVRFDEEDPKKIPFMASSDMGNVSHEVPSIHPTYSIGTNAANHSVEFTQASATGEAHRTTLITAKSMAMLALDLMCDQEFLDTAKKHFKADILEDAGL